MSYHMAPPRRRAGPAGTTGAYQAQICVARGRCVTVRGRSIGGTLAVLAGAVGVAVLATRALRRDGG